MHRGLLALVLAATLLAACSMGPRFDNHPQPTLVVDHEPFAAAGCPTDATGWPRCQADSPLAALGCDTMRPAPDLFGGLAPAYPIAICEIYPHWHDDAPAQSDEALAASEAYIVRRGGLWPVYVRYVIYGEGAFAIIQDLAALQRLYAPIESPEEALSYALAATGMQAMYGLTRQPGYAYEGQRIRDTHVSPAANGYRVLLYEPRIFGCGPHWTFAVELHVRSDGQVAELSRKPAFRDTSTDGMCID